MIGLLIAAVVASTVGFALMPPTIRRLRDRGIGQFIQEDVEGHAHKHGTPTMGGLVIMLAAAIGYLVAHLRIWVPGEGFTFETRVFSPEGLLAIWAFLGMGLIGFIDDYKKVSQNRNLGLSKRWKFLGQVLISGVFAAGAVTAGISTEISFTRTLGLDLGWFYVAWVLLLLVAMANAVNFTDGLDGLVAGSGSLVLGAFVIVGFWQFRHQDFYSVTGALDLGIFAAAVLGATLAFLWYNAAPAEVFMGDVGSNALGGVIAALALLTNTHLLVVILGGLYVLEASSVVLQIVSFRWFGKRLFRMAPIHHHFELKGWPETTVIIRFWILAGIGVAIGLGIFYGDFVANEGLLQ